jgi:hypothetical protein
MYGTKFISFLAIRQTFNCTMFFSCFFILAIDSESFLKRNKATYIFRQKRKRNKAIDSEVT